MISLLIYVILLYVVPCISDATDIFDSNSSVLNSFLSALSNIPILSDHFVMEMRAHNIHESYLDSLLSSIDPLSSQPTSRQVYDDWIHAPLTSSELHNFLPPLHHRVVGGIFRYSAESIVGNTSISEAIDLLTNDLVSDASLHRPSLQLVPLDAPIANALNVSNFSPVNDGYCPPHLSLTFPQNASSFPIESSYSSPSSTQNEHIHSKQSTSSSSSSHNPKSHLKNQPLHVFLPDDRQELVNTSYPWSSVGLLLSVKGVCTGTLVADDLVLTASHCIPWREDGSIDRIRFALFLFLYLSLSLSSYISMCLYIL